MHGRAVMHALSRDAQCEPRNAIRSSQLVFGWRLLIVRSAPAVSMGNIATLLHPQRVKRDLAVLGVRVAV